MLLSSEWFNETSDTTPDVDNRFPDLVPDTTPHRWWYYTPRVCIVWNLDKAYPCC